MTKSLMNDDMKNNLKSIMYLLRKITRLISITSALLNKGERDVD